MKQDIAEFLTDSFVDYEGKKHYVVLCALSSTPTSDKYELGVMWTDENGKINYDEDICHNAYRTLSIGVSICHPDDVFNEKMGKSISRAKAEKSVPKLVSLDRGVINTKLVQAFLRQEMDFIKKYPGHVITGYEEKKAKYNEKQSLKQQSAELDVYEASVVEALLEDVNLDKCIRIAKYLKSEKTN